MRKTAGVPSAAVGAALLLLLSSCTSLGPPPARAPQTASPSVARRAPAAETQRKLAEGGRYVLGRKELVIRGRRFNMDCTGAVLAIYYYAGIDLARDFGRYTGNGVTRLYKSLAAEHLLYQTRVPETGDIIFWDNTYDRNQDGRWNDPLTHVGMVMDVSRDGRIAYVHLSYRKGIVIEYMNLKDPRTHQRLTSGQVKIVNSPMRMRQAGREHPEEWLAGQLYKTFAMGYLF